MLIDLNSLAAPTGLTPIQKAKGIVLTCNPKDDSSVAGYDPKFRHYIFTRYPTLADANNNTNGINVGRPRSNPRTFDNDELVNQNTYYYTVRYITTDDVISAASTPLAVVYRGATTADIEDDAVTDKKRKRRDPSNMIRNADADDVTLWQGSAGLVSIASSIAAESTHRLEIAASTLLTNISTLTDLPVKGGKKYYIEATLLSPDSVAISAQMQVNWYSDLAGTVLIGNTGLGNVNLTTTYEYKGILTAPAGARRARMIAYKNAGASSKFSIAGPVFRVATDEDLLADEAVSERKVKDDAISERKRKRRDDSNMIRDNELEDAGLWSSTSAIAVAGAGGAYASKNFFTQAASTAVREYWGAVDIPVQAGKTYFASVVLGTLSGVAVSLSAYIQWYSMDAAGVMTFISGSLFGSYNGSGSNTLKGLVTAPANARRARLYARKEVSASAANFTMAEPIMRKATDEDLLDNDAVSEPKVKDDAITDRKRKTGDSSNGMRNPECDDSSLWAASIGNVSSLPSGSAVASKNFIATTAMTSQVDIYAGRGGVADLNVKAGKKYFASGYIGTSSGLATSCELYIQWFSMDAAGVMTFISSSLVGTYAGTGIGRVEKVVMAPGTARRARYLIRKLATAAAVTNVILEPEFRLATDKEILADRAVRARHRQQEDNENLIPDGEFEQMAIGATAAVADDILAIWDVGGGVAPTNFWTWDGDSDSGGKALILDNLVAGGAGGGTIPQLFITTVDFIPVKATNYLAWEIARRTTDASSLVGLYVRFLWFDKNKAALGTSFTDVVANAPIPAAWTTDTGFVAVPAGAKYFKLRVFSNPNVTTRYLILDRLFVRKAKGAELTVDGSLPDAKLDQTPPGIPTAVAFSQLTKDTDAGDGRVRINGRVTWNPPTGGVPVRRYIVEVDDGENVESIPAPANRRWIKIKDMVVGRTYNAKVSAESVAGVEGAQSGAVPCTPTAKTTAPGVVTAVSIVQKATFNRIKWSAPADKDYDGANVYHNTVNNPATATLLDRAGSTKYDDTTARAPGALNYYFVEAVNRSGIPAATRVAAANNPVVSRGVGFADTNMTDPNAYAENSDLSLGPNIGWSDPVTIIADAPNAYKGTNVLKRAYTGAASSYVNRNSLYFAVREGEQYVFGGMVKTDGSWAGAGAGWRLSLLNAAGVEVNTTPLAGTGVINTTWREYQLVYTVAAGVAFARLEWASYAQTAGTAFGSHGYIRPVVTEIMTDQTAPAQPAAPVMTVLTADFDKDGELDQGFFMNLPTWAAGTIAVKEWEIEHQVANAQGSSGSMTGYAKRRANEKVKAELSPGTTYYEFKANAQRWHKTRVRGISWSGKEGPWSVYQNLGAQPQEYNAMAGVTPATPSAVATDNGIEITWVNPTSPTYERTEVRQGATVVYNGPGNKYLDKTVRTPGVGYTYNVTHYDRAGHATNPSAASAAATYRQAQSAEIAPKAIIPSLLYRNAGGNLITDYELLEKSQWSFYTRTEDGFGTPILATKASADVAQPVNPTSDAFGESDFKFVLTNNANGTGLRIESDKLSPVEPGNRYEVSCWENLIITFVSGSFTPWIGVRWWRIDGSGNLQLVSENLKLRSGDASVSNQKNRIACVVLAPAGASFMSLVFEVTVSSSGATSVLTAAHFSTPVIRLLPHSRNTAELFYFQDNSAQNFGATWKRVGHLIIPKRDQNRCRMIVHWGFKNASGSAKDIGIGVYSFYVGAYGVGGSLAGPTLKDIATSNIGNNEYRGGSSSHLGEFDFQSTGDGTIRIDFIAFGAAAGNSVNNVELIADVRYFESYDN